MYFFLIVVVISACHTIIKINVLYLALASLFNRQYGFAWPERMKCEGLPEYGNKETLCMDANITDRNTSPSSNPSYNRPASPTNKFGEGGESSRRKPQASGFNVPGEASNGLPIGNVNPGVVRPVPEDEVPSATPKDCSCACVEPLVVSSL